MHGTRRGSIELSEFNLNGRYARRGMQCRALVSTERWLWGKVEGMDDGEIGTLVLDVQ